MVCNVSSSDNVETMKNTVAMVIGITGFLGNAFVIFVFLCNQAIFNTITNLLILNQSTVDLAVSAAFLLGLLQKVFGIQLPQDSEIFSIIVCKLWTSEYLLWSLYVCSSMNLVAISLERFCATCHSIKHLNYFTRRNTKVIMAVVWIFGFIYECHWPWRTEYRYDVTTSRHVCRQSDGSGTAAVAALAGITFFCVEYVVPVAVMSFSYWRIITMLKKRGKQREFFRRAKHSVTKTLLIVSVMFVICWGPAEIEYLLYNLGVEICFGGPMHQLGITLVQLNACLNPFIYSLQYKQFKSILKRTFCPSCLGLEKGSSSEHGPTTNSNTKNVSQPYSHNNV
ncbi:putative galanin receptor type 2-like [Apostichopus japonicus]|uniref:Putative galanin receptor type 2-like n=1 Tax=Stichopus japonicus TaxID=307972 RepID=A0A2G8JU95_STIJA|nr:putative galanin receptor type 2-like [Apostichopus japonicus]